MVAYETKFTGCEDVTVRENGLKNNLPAFYRFALTIIH